MIRHAYFFILFTPLFVHEVVYGGDYSLSDYAFVGAFGVWFDYNRFCDTVGMDDVNRKFDRYPFVVRLVIYVFKADWDLLHAFLLVYKDK